MATLSLPTQATDSALETTLDLTPECGTFEAMILEMFWTGDES